MATGKQTLLAVCFVLHFLAIIVVSSREIVWLIARDLTVLPPAVSRVAQNVEHAATGIAPTRAGTFRQPFLIYLHLAGIERGYGYFAPNISGSYKLVFELHQPGEPVRFELPRVNSAAAGLRLAGLLDEIGRMRSDALREYVIREMAAEAWREHSDVTKIRAIFGAGEMPDFDEFSEGKRESFRFLYAYEFSLRNDEGSQPGP